MCPTCGCHLVEIAVKLGDATLTMHACSTCDRSWWDRDGRPVDLGDVLAMAAAGASDRQADRPPGAAAGPS